MVGTTLAIAIFVHRNLVRDIHNPVLRLSSETCLGLLFEMRMLCHPSDLAWAGRSWDDISNTESL